MKQVIFIDQPKEQEEKPVEFTHHVDEKTGTWTKSTSYPNEYDRVVYLGKCKIDGDMFAAYGKSCIDIHKGHLNSGKY